MSPSTREPSLTTSSSLIADCELSSPRMYWATWGTSSTTRRRIWSGIGPTLPRRPGRWTPAPKVPFAGRPGGSPDAGHRGARRQGLRATRTTRSAPGSSVAQLVVAGEGLHHEAGRLREGRPARPATRGAAGPRAPSAPAARPRGPPRRSWSGATDDRRRVVDGAAGLGHDAARARVVADPLEHQAAVVAGEVVGVRAARRPPWRGRRGPGGRRASRPPPPGRPGVPMRKIELSGMNASAVVAGVGEPDGPRVALHQPDPPRDRLARRPPRRLVRPGEHRRIRVHAR